MSGDRRNVGAQNYRTHKPLRRMDSEAQQIIDESAVNEAADAYIDHDYDDDDHSDDMDMGEDQYDGDVMIAEDDDTAEVLNMAMAESFTETPRSTRVRELLY